MKIIITKFKFSIYRFFRFSIIITTFLLSSNAIFSQSVQITFSEINYHSDSTRDAGDWVELYNYGIFSANISNWVFTDSQFNHFFIIPAGTTLNPGEYLVLCQDIIRFSNQQPMVSNVIGSFNFGLNGKTELIRLYDNLNNLYLSVVYNDSLPWPKGADGKGRTLEIKNPAGNLNDGTNWFDGCMGGSPGSTYLTCREEIFFTEINYNSDASVDAGDWIEIRNIGSQIKDISNWILRDKQDSSNFVIPHNTTLMPGENLVISGDLVKFNTIFPDVNNVIGSFNFGLKSKGEVIRLYDDQGILYYSMNYDNASPWPVEADGDGFTLELSDSSKNTNDGTNWFKGCFGGSPGAYFYTPCGTLSISETNKTKTRFTVYPNPFKDNAYLELIPSNSIKLFDGEITLTISDIEGRLVARQFIINKSLNNNLKFPLSKGTLSPGTYFYQVAHNKKEIGTGKFIISGE